MRQIVSITAMTKITKRMSTPGHHRKDRGRSMYLAKLTACYNKNSSSKNQILFRGIQQNSEFLDCIICNVEDIMKDY